MKSISSITDAIEVITEKSVKPGDAGAIGMVIDQIFSIAAELEEKVIGEEAMNRVTALIEQVKALAAEAYSYSTGDGSHLLL